jgi:DNA-binding transcriptional MerR regulator
LTVVAGLGSLAASRLSGCSPEQLTYWRDRGIVTPRADGYTFRDLVALRMVRTLLDAGIPLRRVRRAVAALADFPGDLAALQLVTDGDRVFACNDDGQILDALRAGQLALFVPVGRIAAAVEADVIDFDREREGFVAGLCNGAQDEAPVADSTITRTIRRSS